MGSDSDLPVMREAADFLTEMKIPFEVKIVSAHRTPKRLYDYCQKLLSRKVQVVIAGAGGAAHLPGMVASMTPLPVIGVPVKSRISMDGWDSVLSILQMPPGIPVATVALNSARNAGVLAAQILGAQDSAVQKRVQNFKKSLENKILSKAKALEKQG
ncbi:MAG: 5-(carboxyamino)imidazole ribonucleotide mutase, partial [Candidatus Omnitrophica bacterium]|nr:5-(carboxyamino)imidazole ribonucleotide mutase [Candidatus Omnitrophota bacterium]